MSLSKRTRVEFLPFHTGQKKIYRTPARRKVLRAGRRFGKTTMLEQIAGNDVARGKLVGWFAPSYKILLPAFEHVKDLLRPILKSSNKTDLRLESVTGGQIEFWTLLDEDAGRSRKYNRVIIDEASLVKRGMKDIWEQAIEPTLLDFPDSTAIAAGTPKGVDEENWFYQICNQPELWEHHHAPTSANPNINPEALAAIIAGRPERVVQQEYMAQFIDWSGGQFFSQADILENGLPVPWPKYCDTVYATCDMAQKGDIQHDGSAIVWFALINYPTPHVIILDWEIIQIDGYFLAKIVPQWNVRCLELAKCCLARMGSAGIYIEDKATGITILQQGRNEGWNVAAIPSELTAISKDARAINISGYLARGQVRISEYAYNKLTDYKHSTKNHFLTQVMQYIIGKKDQDDDLTDCFAYGVAIGLGNDEGF